MSTEPFIAEIRAFPFNFAPRDWANCFGQTMPISQNPTLFSLVDTYYGGDGRLTFGIPMLSGRVPLGEGFGPGLPSYRWGDLNGTPSVVLATSQIPSHTHTARFEDEKSDASGPANAFVGNLRVPGGEPLFSEDASSLVDMGASLPNTGSNQGHENRQPYLALRFCIALDGDYPPRN